MTEPLLTEKEFYSRLGKLSAKKSPRSKAFYQRIQKKAVAKRLKNKLSIT